MQPIKWPKGYVPGVAYLDLMMALHSGYSTSGKTYSKPTIQGVNQCNL